MTVQSATEMKAYADAVTDDGGATKYYLPDDDEQRRYNNVGMRLTDCCAACSTYMDDGTGEWELSCKHCAHLVDFGEGDGSEYRS